jgi:putative ABC transport system permease protein
MPLSTPLAWRNITHRKFRTAAALAGVGFAILLIFMQLGFYDVVFRASTMILDQFAFDAVLISPQYTHLRAAAMFPQARLAQARSLSSVASVSPLYVANASWRNLEDGARRELTAVGVDPSRPSFALKELTQNAERLNALDVALMDRNAQARYGPIREGLIGEVENRRVRIAATYGYGSGFMADASIIVSDRTLFAIAPGASRQFPSIGLVRLAPGVRLETMLADLREMMPGDVQVWSRSQIELNEQLFFSKVKPIGLMFFSGVLLAFSVGAIIMYQILSAEVTNHLKEFATLMAMGYTEKHLVRVVLQQATLFATLGFTPALVMAMMLYTVLGWVTHLPMVMTLARFAFVLTLSIVMCATAGVMASRKLVRADPADLF